MQGLFGIVTDHDSARLIYRGVCSMDGCGGEYGGISTLEGDIIHIKTHHGKFEETFRDDLNGLQGYSGIGVNSRIDRQPIKRESINGEYVVGAEIILSNAYDLRRVLLHHGYCFASNDPVEIVAAIIGKADYFDEGLEKVLRKSAGSCRIIMLTKDGIYAARSRDGARPVWLGNGKDNLFAVSTEKTAFRPLRIKTTREIERGEIVCLSKEGFRTITIIKK